MSITVFGTAQTQTLPMINDFVS